MPPPAAHSLDYIYVCFSVVALYRCRSFVLPGVFQGNNQTLNVLPVSPLLAFALGPQLFHLVTPL